MTIFDPPKLLVYPVNLSSPGDGVVIPAQPSVIIKVYKMFLQAAAVVAVTIKDGRVTDGPLLFNQYGAFILDYDQTPWYIGQISAPFIISLGAPAQLSGRLYVTQG